jgi:hypothetical protein
MHCEVRVCRAGVRSAERIRDPTPATRCRRRGAPGSAPPVASAVPSISGPGNAMVRRLRWVFGSVKTRPCPGTRCSPRHTDTNRDASNAPGDHTRRLLQISTPVKPRLGCAGHSRGAPRSRCRSRRVVVDHPAQTPLPPARRLDSSSADALHMPIQIVDEHGVQRMARARTAPRHVSMRRGALG